MKGMTLRERVIKAINHHEADRIPVDLGATRSTGIHAIAYGNLKDYLGITDGDIRVYDVKQMLADPEDIILKRCCADVVQLHRLAPTIRCKISCKPIIKSLVPLIIIMFVVVIIVTYIPQIVTALPNLVMP